MKRPPFLAGCLILFCAALALWVAPRRTAIMASGITSPLAEPIKVTPLALSADGRLAASDDWLERPVVQVENTSGRPIRYLVVEVSFPGAESSGQQPLFLLAHGQAPGRKPAPKAAGALQPGAKVNLTVSQNGCSGARSPLQAGTGRPSSGSRPTSQINAVVFEDGTAWVGGMLYVADSSNPRRWNPVGAGPGHGASSPEPRVRAMKAGYDGIPAPAPAQESECGDRGPTRGVS